MRNIIALFLSLFFFLFAEASSFFTIAEAASPSKGKGTSSIAPHTVTIPALGTVEIELTYKNTGKKPWQTSGVDAVSVHTTAKRESYMYDRSWPSGVIAANFARPVARGKTTVVSILLNAPAKQGVYRETFSLYVGTKKIPGSDIPFVITVTPALLPHAQITRHVTLASTPAVSAPTPDTLQPIRAAKITQSAEAVTLLQGDVQGLSVGYKNTGQRTWAFTGNQRVYVRSRLSTGSSFSDSSWVSPSVPAVLDRPAKTDDYVVFQFAVRAPQEPGLFIERFALFSGAAEIPNTDFSLRMLVAKGPSSATLASIKTNAPFTNAPQTQPSAPSNVSDSSVSAQTTSTPALSPSFPAPPLITDDLTRQEPLMRVGVYHTKDAIQFTANKDFEVRDNAGALLARVGQSQSVTATFDPSAKLFTIALPGVSSTVSSFVRFVSPNNASSLPDQEIIFEIQSFANRPAWSSSINDNKFRGALEIRYTPATDRVWVINELLMEPYLKGIAEASNNAPYEYLKALIIAARSFAHYHADRATKHASEYFTVRSTDADQIYRGYNAELRLGNVGRAVLETRGVVAWYGSELALTPYFSQSDGRTRAWEEVWSGKPFAHLRSKDDPCCKNLPLLGHGVGMSARGALQLALEGKRFDEILQYYYTGITLRRLYP